MEKEFVSERQAAKMLGVSAVCMFTWRGNGTLPFGIFKEIQYPTLKRVFYDKEALLDWARKFKNN